MEAIKGAAQCFMKPKKVGLPGIKLPESSTLCSPTGTNALAFPLTPPHGASATETSG